MQQLTALATKFRSAPLIRRALSFVIIFVLYSGWIGPIIISSGYMTRFHFDVYGGLGKAVLFGSIALGILLARSKQPFTTATWNKLNIVWLIISGAFFGLAVHWTDVLATKMYDGYVPVFLHVSLILAVLSALIGCFGLTTLRTVIRTYKHELALSAGLAAGFYALLLVVYSYWHILSFFVLHGVKGLLTLAGLHANIYPPRTLLLDKFGVEIAQYCSGIESIALFSGLYIIIGVLDWHKFNKGKLLFVFPLALLVLFGCNILRVFSLILAGYYINPQIAFSLFHTYAGMIFFIVYAGLFWTFFYKRLLLKPRT